MVTGTYTYFADAATFRECTSGTIHPVAIEGANIELERASAGKPIFAEVQARFEMRAPDSAAPPRQHLIVERVMRVDPAGSCEPAAAGSMSLEGTNWVAVEIGGQPVTLGPGQRAPMFSIDPATNRFRGNAGCNQISGEVARGPEGIRFKNVIATKMACPALELETRFLAALDGVTAHRISGQMLELTGNTGAVTVRFTKAD